MARQASRLSIADDRQDAGPTDNLQSMEIALRRTRNDTLSPRD